MLLMVEVKVDLEKCDGDGICVDTCPVEVFEIKDGKSIVIDQDACLVCRACEVQCPNAAIEVTE
jgi:NAD-dependent dihydropyrimidine dehydrogenase PreA subunit